jgi:hypothetical protein
MSESEQPPESAANQPETRSLTSEVIVPLAASVVSGGAGGAVGAYVTQKLNQPKEPPKK